MAHHGTNALTRKKLNHVADEVRDAQTFSDTQSLLELAPIISSLNKQDQEHILLCVVGALRVDFVRTLESVEWKAKNWKYAVVHQAAHLGGVDIVRDMAGELDSLSLQYCLGSASSSPSPGQLETVKLLAPMVQAAKRPIAPAIFETLITMQNTARSRRPYGKTEAWPVLAELFRYRRVDYTIKRMLAAEGRERTGKVLTHLVEFIHNHLHNPEFIHAQAGMKAPPKGVWLVELAQMSSECMNALGAIQASIDAMALDARLPDKTLAAGRSAPRL